LQEPFFDNYYEDTDYDMDKLEVEFDDPKK
jgi:hypothetical protein